VSLLYCVYSVFYFHICLILFLCNPVFLTQKTWNEKVKGKKVLSHPFLGINPNKINKYSQPKMSTRLQIHLGKVQGRILFNVGDVREMTYIGTSLTKEKE
jgi:hypothetical protein